MRFRPARPGDEPAVRALVFEILAEFGLEPEPDGVDADLNDIHASYVRDGGMFEVVVDDDDHVVGSVGLAVADQCKVELRKMYLRRDVRGRGLGRAALERALAFAREQAFMTVELETHSVLEDAIALYERYGFVHHARETCDRCDGVMVLDLGVDGGSCSA